MCCKLLIKFTCQVRDRPHGRAAAKVLESVSLTIEQRLTKNKNTPEILFIIVIHRLQQI